MQGGVKLKANARRIAHSIHNSLPMEDAIKTAFISNFTKIVMIK